MVEILNPEGAPVPVGPYSVAAVAEHGSRTAYISGQVSADASGNLTGVGNFPRSSTSAFETFNVSCNR